MARLVNRSNNRCLTKEQVAGEIIMYLLLPPSIVHTEGLYSVSSQIIVRKPQLYWVLRCSLIFIEPFISTCCLHLKVHQGFRWPVMARLDSLFMNDKGKAVPGIIRYSKRIVIMLIGCCHDVSARDDVIWSSKFSTQLASVLADT